MNVLLILMSASLMVLYAVLAVLNWGNPILTLLNGGCSAVWGFNAFFRWRFLR